MKQIRFFLFTLLIIQSAALLSSAVSSETVASQGLPGATPDTALKAEQNPIIEPVVSSVKTDATSALDDAVTEPVKEEVAPVVEEASLQPAVTKKDAAAVRIASVEVEKVIMTSDEFRDKASVIQKELRDRAEQLKKEYEDLEKQRVENKVSAADLAKKRNNLEIDERDLQIEAEGRQRQLQEEMFVAFQDAVTKVAKKQNFDMIIPRFFYVAEKCNVSDIVLKELNATYNQKKAKAKFAKPQANGAAKVAPKANGQVNSKKAASNGNAKSSEKTIKKS